MGTKNNHLINEARRARDRGDRAAWKQACERIDKSQAECPHPPEAQKKVRLRGKGWILCKWCSKKLADLPICTGRMHSSEPAIQNTPLPEPEPEPEPEQTPYRPSIRQEALALARDLDDEWQCSGGLRHWTDEEKRSYIKRAADLASLVKEILK